MDTLANEAVVIRYYSDCDDEFRNILHVCVDAQTMGYPYIVTLRGKGKQEKLTIQGGKHSLSAKIDKADELLRKLVSIYHLSVIKELEGA